MKNILNYIEDLNQKFKLGNTTEHSFRGDLAQLIQRLSPKILVTNEPKRQACGAPDYILTKNGLPIGFIEAKDLENTDLDGTDKNKNQFDRYKKSLNNLIFTDYLRFHFYKNGEFTQKIEIGYIKNGKILPKEENFAKFTQLLADFCSFEVENIKTSQQLVDLMALKSQLLAEIIEKSLLQDNELGEKSSLHDQFSAFKTILIHQISEKEFADVYAQTITYGLFTARYHDPTLPSFSRVEAYQLLPKSNPFLKKLFGYLAGLEVDTRIEWVVDELISVFLACDVATMLRSYEAQHKDPIVHFYEDYLQAYDPKKRKELGVWYTPTPVVNFMVRALDEILKTDFSLPKGLADNSNIKVKNKYKKILATGGIEENFIEKEYHRVQILDPATGTGTFLAEIILLIYQNFKNQQGLWQDYVQEHLLPRLSGFELLMASYAIAHLKMDLLLQKTGFKATDEKQRLQIYLTNSLEAPEDDRSSPFVQWLSDEANEANRLKRDTPVMCVIGNPPYAVSSNNKNAWIENLTSDYKNGLKEKSFNSLSDDYVKFIRYGEHFIEKNGSGVLAFITNNSFLDGIVFRQMRKKLLKTFDKIYIIDLHGNSKKKETAPDGTADQNVFNIMQGVSINIFVRSSPQPLSEGDGLNTSQSTSLKNALPLKGLGEVFHYDLYGKRTEKFSFLEENSLKTIQWTKLNFAKNEENFFFTPKDFSLQKEYNKYFSVTEFFKHFNSGVKTHDDSNLVSFFEFKENNQKYAYRPFDIRYINYDLEKVQRHRYKTMQHFLKGENLGLIVTRQDRQLSLGYVFVTNQITDSHILDSAGDSTYVFPLYLYSDEENGFSAEKSYNIDNQLLTEIMRIVGGNISSHEIALQVFYYIYAVLHSPTYRNRYKEFLKIDFPKIPYPTDNEQFTKLAALGEKLVSFHLLKNPEVENFVTSYPISGTNIVLSPTLSKGEGVASKQKAHAKAPLSFGEGQGVRIYINDTQYFENVPLSAWEFFVGGYQPAQKWLKDRKGQVLDFQSITHYQKMIVSLLKTQEMMQEIDEIISFPK